MSNSNGRVKDYETVHHLISRIAHRVYFLKDDERRDFLEIVRRAADFTGIQLLGWCVMGNHFHLLAFLPSPPALDEQEILRRYTVLKGAVSGAAMSKTLAEWHSGGKSGRLRISEWLAAQRKRMYSIGSFMKIVKQWFTEEYNRRNGHKGTLWESTYFDRSVPKSRSDMGKRLAYIHLNPIRAAETDRFDGYVWSSYSAFCKGDDTATAGMRFIYGEECSCEEIASAHERVLEALLEEEKLRRAEEIARKRAAGYDVPEDPLTREAMIVQEAAHLAEVRKAAVELHEARKVERRRRVNRELRNREALTLLKENPGMEAPLLGERLGVCTSMAYRILHELRNNGLLNRSDQER